ncbi:MAG: hypothetical protein ACE5IH_07965, partial [Thermodesulfobacteriota bacterium]
SNIRLIELQKQRAIWQAKLNGATDEEIENIKKLYDLRKEKEEEALRRQKSQLESFKGGFKDVVKSWGDAMSQMEQIGRDTANAIQSQFSNLLFDFASGDIKRHNKEIKAEMSEMEEGRRKAQEIREEYEAGRISAEEYKSRIEDVRATYDSASMSAEEYSRKMEELKSQLKGVGDYALSAARAILRSLTDAMSKQIASGFLEWLGNVWRQGILKNHEDSKAIVNNITLTGVLGKQIPVVYGLASAYKALGIAKMFAGMGGGFGGGGTTLFPPGTTNPNFGVSLPHAGGLIKRMHAGGLKRDEVPAILQAGEYVINRRDTARNLDTLRAINSGRQAEDKRPIVIHNIIDPNFITSARRSDNEIINVISADIGRDGITRQTIKKYL